MAVGCVSIHSVLLLTSLESSIIRCKYNMHDYINSLYCDEIKVHEYYCVKVIVLEVEVLILVAV